MLPNPVLTCQVIPNRKTEVQKNRTSCWIPACSPSLIHWPSPNCFRIKPKKGLHADTSNYCCCRADTNNNMAGRISAKAATQPKHRLHFQQVQCVLLCFLCHVTLPQFSPPTAEEALCSAHNYLWLKLYLTLIKYKFCATFLLSYPL